MELRERSFTQIITMDINPSVPLDGEEPYWINPRTEKELSFPVEKILLTDKFSFYTTHLFHLGLAGFADYRRRESVRHHDGRQNGTRKFSEFRLEPLGRAFVAACIPVDNFVGEAPSE